MSLGKTWSGAIQTSRRTAFGIRGLGAAMFAQIMLCTFAKQRRLSSKGKRFSELIHAVMLNAVLKIGNMSCKSTIKSGVVVVVLAW